MMALAEREMRDFWDCDNCDYLYFATETGVTLTECPQCGPAAKARRELRREQIRRENQIRRLNEQLQAGIYE